MFNELRYSQRFFICLLWSSHALIGSSVTRDVYKIASHNYLIKEGGSGYGKFMDNELLIDEGMADYQVLIEYMTKTLEGKIGQEYAKLEGRITIK